MFLGRAPDMERLDHLVAAAREGRGERLLVAGVPGIGKTTLLDVAARRAVRHGVRVVRARAAEGSADLPNSLLDDLLAAARRLAGTDVSASSLLPLLAGLTATGPVLVLVDDLHNADEASRSGLLTSVGRMVDQPISVAAATRPQGSALAMFASWPRLDLGPLSDEASATVLRSVLGPDADPVVLAELGRALQGLPLALCEVSRLLTPDQLAGVEPLPEPLPVAPALMAAWTAVIDRLPDRARAALLDLAVSGARPDLAASLAAGGWRPDDLDAAVAAGLVRTDGGSPAFTHPLVRDVVLRGAPGAVLRSRHAAAARAAAGLQLPPAVVVHHLTRSVVVADAAAADAVAAQAVRAERLGHLDAASRAWAAAARLSVDPASRTERALRGVRLVARFDLGVWAIEPLLDLLAGVELDPAASGWIGWLRAVQRADVDPHAALVAQWTAIERSRDQAPDALPVMLWEAAMAAWTLGLPELGLQAAAEIAALDPAAARDEPSPAGPLRAWPAWTGDAMLAAGLIQAGDVTAGTVLRERALARAAEVDPAGLDVGALLDAVFLDDLLLDESPAGARRLAVAEDRLHNAPEPLACLWGIEAWRLRATGDWAAARAMLSRARPLATASGAAGAMRGLAALATELAAACAEPAVAEAEAAELRPLVDRWGDRRRGTTLDRAMGLRALLDGRLDDAFALLSAAAEVPFLGRGLRDGVVPARVDLVELEARRGDRSAALVRAHAVVPLLEAYASPAADALRYRVEALVAEDLGRADDAYRASLAAHERSSERFEHGRTELLLGEHLRRTGRRREARPWLVAAVATFDRLGAAPWRERAEAELREAADHLSLSPRTVEHHLGSCYRKLGVRGRGALTRLVLAQTTP